MERIEINSQEDLYCVLDRLNENIDWNSFYTKRIMKAPFLVNSTLPDKAIAEFIRSHRVTNAFEFGCGEGRNAVFLAKSGIDVTAIDSSRVAIEHAKERAEGLKNLRFICGDCLSHDFQGRRYDLVIDSGMFHHLAPHRRLQYRDLLKTLLKDGGYYILLCFAADAGGADEIDDLQFYSVRNTGVAFSEERIRHFFEPHFSIVRMEICKQEITDEYMEIPFLFACIMRLPSDKTTD